MDAKRLEEIRERAEKAISGPYVAKKYGGTSISIYKGPVKVKDCGMYHQGEICQMEDPEVSDFKTKDIRATADFFVHARQDIPDLLVYIGELLGAVREIMKAIPLADDTSDESICEVCPGNTRCFTWKCDSCPPVRLQKLIGGSGE